MTFVVKLYKDGGLSSAHYDSAVKKIKSVLDDQFQSLKTELCFYIVLHDDDVEQDDMFKLHWILGTPFQEDKLSKKSIKNVKRIEYTIRYLIKPAVNEEISSTQEEKVVSLLHDKMTQSRYIKPIVHFDLELKPEDIYEIDIMEEGRAALEKANKDLAQSNSEHSRHWFFRGRLIVDGEEYPESLFKMIMATQQFTNDNNVIKFSDNSSGIKGFDVRVLQPTDTTQPSLMMEKEDVKRHIIFTAETHNFPTGVAPFPGATTGTGGRIRDVQSAGKGAHVVAGTVGYSFGNLNIPGYNLPWEDQTFVYPQNFALPLEIAIEASNGASDYGNKFGEPVLAGFARSYGLKLSEGERREYIKPIMFSGGIGQLEHSHIDKDIPEVGMEVAKIGGPVYRIGVGGGAASSVHIQGDNKVDLDFGAVQRGDAEMEQKLNRVIRACVEMGEKNPILSIHDQGAGGNGNVLKEIVEPAGAVIRASDFQLGDPTISILELWGAEYQESNAILVKQENKELVCKICERERCPVKLKNFHEEECDGSPTKKRQKKSHMFPVDLQLDHVLGSMPRKEFRLDRQQPVLRSLELTENLKVLDALERVLRLPCVASKRYLTNKVDRCVTGLVAQQQCVGPLHTPLADVAVTALSYLDLVGSATAIGEQPIKGLIDPACGARMSVGESLTNLNNAITFSLMITMCEVMKKLGVAVDGGKDSLSMAARVGDKTVKAPGTLVVIGGTALAQCYKQLGDAAPDLDHPEDLVKAFNVTQKLLTERKLTAGHDISDGGLVTCLLEMSFSGNCGMQIDLSSTDTPINTLFTEELGFILEVSESHRDLVIQRYQAENVSCCFIGHSKRSVDTCSQEVLVSINGDKILQEKMVVLRDSWEETSFEIEKLQANPKCVVQEQAALKERLEPPFHIPFESEIINFVPKGRDASRPPVSVAVLREEGSNSDREMAAVLHMAGFEVWDINMQDLCSGSITLDQFQGLVFVGGFSYADVCGSAKGWAATSLFNKDVQEQLMKFKERPNTFSLGVCNGCQLMGILGWVAPDEDLKVLDSPAIMLSGMSDMVFGVWSAHGEGKMVFRSQLLHDDILRNSLAPVRYVNDQGIPTTQYPFNPNGSPDGIAALCSEDGRHLAIMPHPERCFLPWQCPWMPLGLKENLDVSPWFKMFQNAFDWCIQQL
ncbi:hypothetical protein KUTeg_024677 [Tegillarca granosa]|uniref:Phosphoribosylformylglycinamidine synthase n=1 Tax=Tegillarca granosa TaxID=220873 RepID=A0ABQ9DY11_TEGGR|nr:hypothetical protein KUTeg_024677 [Tegillarca granosa]